jgi:transposase
MAKVPKTSRVEHQTPKKARFKALVQDAGWTQEAAARRIKVSQPAANRWLKQDSDCYTGKFRSGRHSINNEKTIERIEKWFEGFYDYRIQNLTDIIKHFNLEYSPTTLCRALEKRGFRKHMPEMKE